MLVAFSVLSGSVRIGIFRRGDIFYIFIGVVFCSDCFRGGHFCIRLVVFQFGLRFAFGCFRKVGLRLQF